MRSGGRGSAGKRDPGGTGSRGELENRLMLFDAVRFRYPPESRRWCGLNASRRAGRAVATRSRLYKETKKRQTTGAATRSARCGSPCVLLGRASSGAIPRGEQDYMGRRLSMLSISESVELRPFPLSLTRSLMRMPGRVAGCEVGGGGVRPSLRGGLGCRAPFCWGG